MRCGLTISWIVATTLLSGCGTQHIRLEDNPAGFDDALYMLESTLKLYEVSLDESPWEEPYQFAPFALVYTGPAGCEVTIEATLEEYEDYSRNQTVPVPKFAFGLREEVFESQQETSIQRSFDPIQTLAAGDARYVASFDFEDDTKDRTRYFQLFTPREGGLRSGHWYRLSLATASQVMSLSKTPAPPVCAPASQVTYDFYVSASNTLASFALGTTLIVFFSTLGI